MSPSPRSLRRAAVCAVLITASALLVASQAPSPERKDEEMILLTPFEVSTGNLGATPGGSKDIRVFRSRADSGEIPHPNTITPEGLFSEHDLPLEVRDTGSSDELFRVQTAATAARFEVLPDVRYLAQLGFSSSLRLDTWQPAPLNLVAVVDKSGSMSGQPLALVRASLKSALRHLRDGDQLSIVLYGDRAHVHLPTTVVGRATRSSIARQIDEIASMGSTDMESGLRLGYQVARESKAAFKGNTRVMLFTDERPNVGNTAAEGFMAMAEDASTHGIGLTTIGVGIQFGADLAARISSVRGGNLFFFPNADEMQKTFADEWDTLVTELAHDFSVRIEPARGFRVAGVFGVPANLLRWDGGAIVLDIATIFLSPRKGAIYFALAPDRARDDLPAKPLHSGDTLARVKFSYHAATSGERVNDQAECRFVPLAYAQSGLVRGASLVDEYLTLKKAAHAHHVANDQETAFRLAAGLLKRLNSTRDPSLNRERELVRGLHATLAVLAGHGSEARGAEFHPAAEPPPVDDLSGLPPEPVILVPFETATNPRRG